MKKIRVSIATASILGLKNYRTDVAPSTLYFLLPGECKGNCYYCEHKKGYLARVRWPEFDFKEVKEKVKKLDAKIKRICIQSIYGEDSIKNIVEIVKEFDVNCSFSTAINAISLEEMKILKENGIERVGIGLDCFTEELFNKWKKGIPSWNEYMTALKNAKRLFGFVTCHLIAGLGENDYEAIQLMKKLSGKGIDLALFAYSKGKETVVELPRYRVLQLARYFIKEGKFYFENGKLVEMQLPYFDKKAFLTAGCPFCNRPFYNERITKIYNYPYELDDKEALKALKEAEKYARIYFTSQQ